MVCRSAEETSGVVSWTTGSGESSEGQPEQRRMWSREEFTHEHAGTGGPDVAMRLRYDKFYKLELLILSSFRDDDF